MSAGATTPDFIPDEQDFIPDKQKPDFSATLPGATPRLLATAPTYTPGGTKAQYDIEKNVPSVRAGIADVALPPPEKPTLGGVAKAALGPALPLASGLVSGVRQAVRPQSQLPPTAGIGYRAASVLGPTLGANPETMEQAETPGRVMGQASVPAALALSPLAVEGAIKTRGAIGEAAMGNPDVAALRSLKVGPDTKAASRTLSAVDISRPYLKGVKTQAEAQSRIAPAKAEVWAPRQAVVDQFGTEKVHGPDGPSTMAELEAERVQLSAINRGLKVGDPSALKLAEQKGLSQAQAIERERAINQSLDAAIGRHGVDSQAVRKTFAGLSRVEGRLSGRMGELETAPMGLGKIVRGARVGGGIGGGGEIQGHGGFFTEPLYRVGQAGRDIAAGRGWWSGHPADINIREGFRVGGEKPNLGRPIIEGEPVLPPPPQLPRRTGGTTVLPSGEGQIAFPPQRPQLPSGVRGILPASSPYDLSYEMPPNLSGTSALARLPGREYPTAIGPRITPRAGYSAPVTGEPKPPTGAPAKSVSVRGPQGKFKGQFTSEPVEMQYNLATKTWEPIKKRGITK